MDPSSPISPQQNPYMFTPTPAPQPRKTGLVILMVCITLLLLGVIGFSAYRMFAGEGAGTTTAAEDKITLYYRDGETVLWDSKNGSPGTDASPAFAAYAKEQLDNKYGSANTAKGTWQVTTTLDVALQRAAREQLSAQKEALAARLASDVAFVAQEAATGHIVAWVGGWNELLKSDNEDTVTKKREPGTLMLPLAYTAFLETSTTSSDKTEIEDSLGPLGGYPCTKMDSSIQDSNCLYNLDSMFLGRITIREALGGVRLVPAVKAAEVVGVVKVQAIAEKLGAEVKCYSAKPFEAKNEAPCYEAMIMGDGAFTDAPGIVQAYSTLANKGTKASQTPLAKIVRNGEIQNDWQAEPVRAVREKVAATIVSILGDESVTYSSSIKEVLTASSDTKTGIAVGFDVGSGVFGAVQLSSKYVAGVWIMGADQPLTGELEPAVLPITSGWMDAARK